MPSERWTEYNWKSEMVLRSVPIVDYGYNEMNEVNWGYIYSSNFNDPISKPETFFKEHMAINSTVEFLP